MGLFMASCEESPEPEETDKYTVTVRDAGAGFQLGDYHTEYKQTAFYPGDSVWVVAGTPPAGAEFGGWVISPASVNVVMDRINSTSGKPNLVFIMPSSNVTVTGTWVTSAQSLTHIRFSWPDSARTKLGYDIVLSASYTDVENWKNVTYEDPEYSQGYDNTDDPWADGSDQLDDSFYVSSDPSTHFRKSKYFDIDPGKYTAICEVEDEHGFFDIVANYEITLVPGNTAGTWFEVAFDIVDFVEYYNDPNWGDADPWYDEKYDNPNTPPMLQKSKARKFLKKVSSKKVTDGGSIEITYYVFHRNKR
jgi:hypothetical protein